MCTGDFFKNRLQLGAVVPGQLSKTVTQNRIKKELRIWLRDRTSLGSILTIANAKAKAKKEQIVVTSFH